MKSTSIIFITFNSINKHLLHALQMHTHTYIQRVHDSEPYSGIQGRREPLWTLVDPNIIIPYIIDNRMTDFPHHHSIMYDFTPPIFSCLVNILLLFVRTFSP